MTPEAPRGDRGGYDESLDAAEEQPTGPPALGVKGSEPPMRPRPWQSMLLSISFALFCLEIGAFLVVFPWLDSWNLNYFSAVSSRIQDIWDAQYFRGAISGIGLLNVWVALHQIRNLFRS